MGSFDRYIFRTTFGAFLLVLVSLTTVIWLTHAKNIRRLVAGEEPKIGRKAGSSHQPG